MNPLTVSSDTTHGSVTRSKCIFPTSNSGFVAAQTWATVQDELIPSSTDPHRASPGSDEVRRLVKAAWALTLQCFIVADTFTFKCFDSVDAPDLSLPLDGQRGTQRPHSTFCIARIDLDDLAADFTAAFASSAARDHRIANSSVVFVPLTTPHHTCNTSVAVKEAGVALRQDVELLQSIQSDLHLTVEHSYGPATTAKLMYKEGLVDDERAKDTLQLFRHIYAQLIEPPHHLYLRDVDKCPPDHFRIIQKFTAYNDVAEERCVHDMIVEQCERRPDDLAVISWDQNLTYAQLDKLSARLAYYLQKLGVGLETFVLSCFNKSSWAIIARLAIMRAGGAYVSIHADNPPFYLSSVISQTNTRILLTDVRFASTFSQVVPTTVVLSPELFQSLPLPNKMQLTTSVHPGSACLVLFTSGSTGTPKGIIQVHRSYATAIKNYARDLQLGSDTRYLQFDDYAFDISNVEFLTPLVVGGCCVVPDSMSTVQDLANQISINNVNILFLTPTVAVKLDPSDVPSVRNLCIGGEPLSKDLIRRWQSSSTRLLCQYGMGEAAVCCALNTTVSSQGQNTVGRPSTGTIWIVDALSTDKLMPVGACGEIVIEGPHLARGYLDPAHARRANAGFLQTPPLWIKDLHPTRRITQFYKSGDLGRLNHDGSISYLGRKDNILKLDGCRIDAMEIEHLARKCLFSGDTVVVDLMGVPEVGRDPRLTALIHLEDHPSNKKSTQSGQITFHDAFTDAFAVAKAEAIRSAIAQVLPPFMVPTLFLVMDQVPRTASKKVDRKKIKHFSQKWYMESLQQFDLKGGNNVGVLDSWNAVQASIGPIQVKI